MGMNEGRIEGRDDGKNHWQEPSQANRVVLIRTIEQAEMDKMNHSNED